MRADTVHFESSATSVASVIPGFSGRPLRVLTMTTLYPNSVEPRHGIFVETRMRKLLESAPIDLQVVAPVPWFPFRWPIAGRYANYAAVPEREQRGDISVRHPRYLSLPHIGMSIRPASVASAAMRAAGDLRAEGWSCDVIDAHYLYPDGVAAATLARRLQRPFVVTARGSDVNLIAKLPAPRRRILDAVAQASRVIAVSEALKAELLGIGVAESRVEVLRNGVDTNLFKPVREDTRKRLGANGAYLVAAVGNLVPEKGHDLVLRAARLIENVRVVVVGQGRERERLIALTDRLGMKGRVTFLDNVPQAELASIYSAADVLALGSVREGWPNVLLEAMACGTPVVATAVGGVPEIVTSDIVGETVSSRDEQEFAAAIRRVLDRRTERAAVRAHASKYSWQPIVKRYYEILSSAAQAGFQAARGVTS
jgi:glycosyltransferase involved in cell wall biosynthesis